MKELTKEYGRKCVVWMMCVIMLFGTIAPAYISAETISGDDGKVQESVSEPTNETVSDPTGDSVSNPTNESESDPTGESVTDPTDESVTDPTGESVTDPTDESEQPTQPEMKVLMVGNSFTSRNSAEEKHNVGKLMEELAEQNDKKLDVTVLANSAAYLRYYAFWSDEYKEYHEDLIEALKKEQYDYIVLQDQTKAAVEKYEDEMLPSVRQIYNYVQSYQKNAKILLYQTAAFEDGKTTSVDGVEVYLGMQEFQERNLYGYFKLQNALNIEVVPIGMLAYHSGQLYPNINLVSSDLRHPNFAGYYVATAGLYYRIFGEIPKASAEKLTSCNITDEQLVLLSNLVEDRIQITQKSVSLEMGKTTMLQAEVKAAAERTGTIFWKSLNPDIATVDSATGVVTGVTEGTAAVFAETTTGLVAVCHVVVENTTSPDIKFARSNYQVSVGDTIRILPMMKDWTVMSNCKWSTGSAAKATVSHDGTVTARKIGKVTIYLKNNTTKEVLASYALYISGNKPYNVSAKVTGRTASGGTVKVTWSPVNSATVYRVYRYDSETKVYKLVGKSETTSYVDKDVKGSLKYYYKVTSGGSSSLTESNYSAKTNVVVLKPVTLQIAAAKNKYIRLKWNKDSLATKYEIYRSTKKNSGYKLIKTIKSKSTVSYSDKTVKRGKVYYYRIKTYREDTGITYYSKYSDKVKARAGTKKKAKTKKTTSKS